MYSTRDKKTQKDVAGQHQRLDMAICIAQETRRPRKMRLDNIKDWTWLSVQYKRQEDPERCGWTTLKTGHGYLYSTRDKKTQKDVAGQH